VRAAHDHSQASSAAFRRRKDSLPRGGTMCMVHAKSMTHPSSQEAQGGQGLTHLTVLI
jgi:hypothetical protein